MIDDLFCALLTFVVLAAAAVAHPQQLRAPRDWYFEGVRADGATTLRAAPPAGCGEPRPPNDRPCPDHQRAIDARIYCTGGAVAILVDARTVGCQRRFQ